MHQYNNDYKVFTGFLPSPWGHQGCDLKVSVKEYGVITIGKASLCKWFHGDNLAHYLTRMDVEHCIESISDILHISANDSRIIRLDIGYNIITDHNPKLYLSHLGEMPRYGRFQLTNENIYYKNTLRKYLIYDKIKEQKTHRKPIPADFKNANVVRLELQVMKRIERCFHQPSVRAGMLYDKKFYGECLDLWAGHYRKIQKKNDTILNFKVINTRSSLYQFGLLCALNEYGELELLRQIREGQQLKQLSRKQALDLRDAIKIASTSPKFTTICPLISELDAKIEDAVQEIKSINDLK